jgi:hypothetical protein
MRVSLDQPIEVRTRAVIRRCPECVGRLIKFGGYVYQDQMGSNVSFHVGRICKRCNILYIDPKFEKSKIIFNKIGAL